MWKPIVMACYSNLVVSRRAPELMFCDEISEFCVCTIISLLISAVISGPVGFSCDRTDVEDIAARGVLLPLPDNVCNFVQSFRSFRIMPDYTAKYVQALFPIAY